MTILDELAAYARERVKQAKEEKPLELVREEALAIDIPEEKQFAFEKALLKSGVSFICECKKASPSKGVIAENFPYLEIARSYEVAGADAISVLTEPKWFLGSDAYLKEIAANVSIPVIRKDFTVDEYMIYEAKVLGASAVLLIVSLLSEDRIREYIEICDKLGLSALVECHDEDEIKTALRAGARVVGVNNRNLKDFSVDIELAGRLRACVPEGVAYVSESGITGPEDMELVRTIKADAVLIGEAMMRAENKAEFLSKLKG